MWSCSNRNARQRPNNPMSALPAAQNAIPPIREGTKDVPLSYKHRKKNIMQAYANRDLGHCTVRQTSRLASHINTHWFFLFWKNLLFQSTVNIKSSSSRDLLWSLESNEQLSTVCGSRCQTNGSPFPDTSILIRDSAIFSVSLNTRWKDVALS